MKKVIFWSFIFIVFVYLTAQASDIPQCAFRRGFGDTLTEPGTAMMLSYNIIDDGDNQGLPIGGFGSGSIGRSFCGDFVRWHLDIGRHRYRNVNANQFSIWTKIEGQNDSIVQVLNSGKPEENLDKWTWGYPAQAGTYYALFPYAWYVYDWEKLPVKLTCQQFSPVIPNNYQTTSYPVGIFDWTIENKTDKNVEIALMFTWQNMVGWFGNKWNYSEDLTNFAKQEKISTGKMTGIVLSRNSKQNVTEKWDGEFCIVAIEDKDTTVSYKTSFATNKDGNDLWREFADDGVLSNDKISISGPIGAAISVKIKLAPKETKTFPIVLSWDLPVMEFSDKDSKWYRMYTKYFGKSGHNSWEIAKTSLLNYPDWEKQIETWQKPVIDDQTKPDWYKGTLFNELYYLVDGGTAWENGSPNPALKDSPGDHKFAYLECFDYPYYETLDVRFYGSFPLIMLWPEIEKEVMRSFAPTIDQEDLTQRTIVATGTKAPRKLRGIVPHDLGSTRESPWVKINAYDYQNPSNWKDLNSKYVLLIYRDYVLTGSQDKKFLKDTWPSCKKALFYLKKFDQNNDGMIENEGMPDQTYDTWVMKGTSSYCGSLWIAALEAGKKMAEIVNDKKTLATLTQWEKQARDVFEKKLWNGDYYSFDQTNKTIMADQLVGQWYADICGLPRVASAENTKKALQKIFAYNVTKFQNGQMGAINGMLPDGNIDPTSEQSQEVWTGVSYGLASFMLLEGLKEEALKTGWGIYNVTYQQKGYWFRTPESWNKFGEFRASMYMRPQSIWAMELGFKK